MLLYVTLCSMHESPKRALVGTVQPNASSSCYYYWILHRVRPLVCTIALLLLLLIRLQYVFIFHSNSLRIRNVKVESVGFARRCITPAKKNDVVVVGFFYYSSVAHCWENKERASERIREEREREREQGTEWNRQLEEKGLILKALFVRACCVTICTDACFLFISKEWIVNVKCRCSRRRHEMS